MRVRNSISFGFKCARCSARRYSVTKRSSPANCSGPVRPLRRLERERGEVEPCRPALGPFVESVRLDIRHVHTRVREQRAGLGVGEREVCGTDLQKLASRAIARERKRDLSAAREHEQRARRDVQGKGVDHVEGARVSERMDVVEHDDHRGFERRDRRTEPRDRCRPQRVSSGRHATEHSTVDGLDGVQRRRDVAEEHHGVVVGVVERHPGERPHVLGRPLGEQRGLPVPGGRRDADVARLVAPAESRDERRPAQRAPPLRRNCELRREQVEGGRAARLLADAGPEGPCGDAVFRSTRCTKRPP